MAYFRCMGGGSNAEDGNDIVYPIAQPSDESKLYVERDVSNIAYALGESLTVSEMAGAVKTIVEASGLTTYKGALAVLLAESSIVEYEVVN